MRVIVTAVLCILAAPVSAQSLSANLSGGVSSGLTSGFAANLSGGISSGFGSARGSGTQDSTVYSRNGIYADGCAPGHVDINHTGCRPAREIGVRSTSSYDTSVAAMRPLSGVALDGLTLSGTTLQDTTLDSISGLSLSAGGGSNR